MAEELLVYGSFIENLMSGNIADLSGGAVTLKCALLDRSHTPSQNHDNWGQISSDEVDDGVFTDYAAQNVVVDVSYANRVTLLEAPVETVFGLDVTITAGYAVLYDDRPVADADKKLVALIDFGEERSAVSGVFKIEWGAVSETNAILKVTVAAPAE